MAMNDELLMQRCLKLAKLGEGCVSPNPMVGAVVVYDNKIIGEGYHQLYGFSHAEPNAINSVEDKELLKSSTLYVNLEPCCHWGKTPPCADLIIKSGIKKIVICNNDPNPKVSGGGIKILKDAGVEIITGVLEKQGRELNKRFFCYHEKKRPYITLKWAETLDGFIDIERRKGKKEDYWITNDYLKVWVHNQRAVEDCVLVGNRTVINDNPKLNVRHLLARNPIRMTIDRRLIIPENTRFYDKSQKTIIFNEIKDDVSDELSFVKIDFEKDVLGQIIHYIYSIGKNSLVVEGGKFTLEEFIDNNLWDEANVLVGNKHFEKGVRSPKELLNVCYSNKEYYGDDWIEYYNNK